MKINLKRSLYLFRAVILLLLSLFIGLYIGLMIRLTVFQSRLIYFPGRKVIMTPDRIGLSYENVYFKTEDGVNLNGWFVPAKNAKGVILFCHGNGGNISDRLSTLQLFSRLGLSTFIFDYRGYGHSEGKITEKGTYLDAEAAWSYLIKEKKTSSNEIIIFGRSLGSAIAVWLAQEHIPKVLIVESAFASIQDMAAELYPYFPTKFLVRFDYKTIDYIRRVKCPVLVIHSPEDEIIPFSHGRKLFAAANGPKEFIEIKGNHNDGFIISAKLYENGLNSFISKYMEK